MLKLGDIVYYWISPIILVECKIIRVEKVWTHPDPEKPPLWNFIYADNEAWSLEDKEGYTFDEKNNAVYYNIDEPTGHAVAEHEEIFSSVEEAIEYNANISKAGAEHALEDFRYKAAKFILSTHLPDKDYGKQELVNDEQIKKFLSKLPNKKVRRTRAGSNCVLLIPDE